MVKVANQNDPDFYKNGGWGHNESTESGWLTRHVVKPYNLEPGMTLLDLGCGDGLHARLFARKGLVVTGIDVNSAAVKVAVENAESDEKLDTKPAFLVRDTLTAHGLGTFDVVFARGLPQTGRPDSPGAVAVMRTAKDSLKPGALAFVLRSSDGSGEDSDGSFPGSRTANPTLEDFEAMVARSGLEVVEAKQTGKLVFVAARRG